MSLAHLGHFCRSYCTLLGAFLVCVFFVVRRVTDACGGFSLILVLTGTLFCSVFMHVSRSCVVLLAWPGASRGVRCGLLFYYMRFKCCVFIHVEGIRVPATLGAGNFF